jgi:transposase
MIFVGADVHVRNTYFYATDGAGRRLGHGRVLNTAAELRSFCEALLTEVGGELQPVRFVLEATTNSRPVQRQLRQAAGAVGFDEVAVDVLDARKLRIIAESVAKCDALDARVLNQLSRANLALPVCYMPDDEEFALREHLRARSDLVRMRTMIKNRIHAVLHRRGVLTPKEGLFSRAGRTFLDKAPLDEAGRTLGLTTALTLLAELGDLKRFKSRAAVANYAGLVPVVRDSNSKHFSGGITHRGSAHLRHVLSEAAWTAVKRVPVYAALFERVTGRRGKQIAIVAVARRMLEDAVRMLWKEEAFRFVPVTAEAAQAEADRRRTPRSGRSVRAATAVVADVASSVAG